MTATARPRSLALPQILGSAEATALADRLRAARGAPLELDASAVGTLGGLCLEVLLSAAATWRADGLPLTVPAPSAAVLDTLRVAGLSADALTAGDAA